MASSNAQKYEIDERAWDIIKSRVLELQKYFPTPQDRKMYERKVNELFTKLRVDVREKVIVNGRTNSAADAGAAAAGTVF